MTEQLPRSDTFDDLLPEIPLDHNELAYKNGALTAEAIGYTALSRDLLPKEGMSPQRSYDKAWSVIELGVTAPSYRTRQGFLGIADERLSMILEAPAASDNLRMRTIMTRVAIPSFRARAEQEPLTESLQHVTYHHLTESLSTEASREIYQGKGENTGTRGAALGILCEALTYAMLLKSGDPALFPFPAAPREDHSDVGDQNHDLYIPFRDGKIPAQVKRKHGAFRHDGIIGINLLTHINQQLNLPVNRSEVRLNRRWAKELSTLEPDVLIARYLDPTNPRCAPENVAIANILIDGLSKSICTSVRTQMADIIRRKGLGVSSTDDLV